MEKQHDVKYCLCAFVAKKKVDKKIWCWAVESSQERTTSYLKLVPESRVIYLYPGCEDPQLFDRFYEKWPEAQYTSHPIMYDSGNTEYWGLCLIHGVVAAAKQQKDVFKNLTGHTIKRCSINGELTKEAMELFQSE